ncbi:hypothetical protein QWI17_03040 [Gilvimarinus sp. SDUM040013]|uniref:Uncharacterized protein n=1 Tax=Gilvimarinus gilvus TaxID=3058038 RepID=A0ABU4S117_9GAMM|nr:hypothetical protein [Gilvimarinus sp. SDUM040013]MDO3384810.1 hypothetical protein [Gilvimarinus sp. SDUM040013]MDX6850857.1 hypothetical protein [Gilvimarinus sp. SDUM040013]
MLSHVTKLCIRGHAVNGKGLHSIPRSTSAIVLTRSDWRVEIHLRLEPNGVATLLAYAGRDNTPERSTQQGPFQTTDVALGARRAIVVELLKQNYQIAAGAHPVWSLNAQRDIKISREIKQENALKFDFDPKDVFLDW